MMRRPTALEIEFIFLVAATALPLLWSAYQALSSFIMSL